MDPVHDSFGEWTRDLGKMPAAWVFDGPTFRDAAARMTVPEIVELYTRVRNVAPVPEDHWRADFARVFNRGRDALPPPDWVAFQRDYGPGVYETIDADDAEGLRTQDNGFRDLGFRLVDVRLTTDFLIESLPALADWFAGAGEAPREWSPEAFAHQRQRFRAVEVLRELKTPLFADRPTSPDA